MPHRSVKAIIEDQELIIAPGNATVASAAKLMKQAEVGAVMVVEDGKLVGIFTERDALFRVVAEGRDPQQTCLAEVMTREPRTIEAHQAFPEALNIMHGGGFRHVPVLEKGRPIGMLSARDALGPELEDFIYEMLRQDQVNDVLPG
ncbi:MAG: CBS domain-containing protein [Gammaproteobacteria bacterium]